MGTAIKQRLWALGAALSLLICVPLVKPWLDMGTIGDDTSYTRTAQLLAETGHIVYNGWATAMLGWQLYWGALFIRLFGFSFDVTRMSMLPVAMAAAFLSQRSMVRAGLTEWNATLATLTLVLSPLFLPLTFSYMTDVAGFFAIVMCFYLCLRALQADTNARACWWIAFAALSNGVGGTVRQTGWLGLLILIPATLWLLRGRKPVQLVGTIFVLLGLSIMVGAMQWFKHQPMAVAEPLWRGALSRDELRTVVRTIARTLFDGLVFLLPVLLVFLLKVRWSERRVLLAFLTVGAAICALLMLIQRQPAAWIEPTIGTYVTSHGVMDASGINGARPVILTEGFRIFLTAMVIGGVSAMVVVLWGPRSARSLQSECALPWSSLILLIAPFSAAYIGLMASRGAYSMVFDRYLLPLLFFFLLFITRNYQQRVSRQLPRITVALVAIVAIYAIGATHDAFAMLRARLEAVRELQARGVPDAEIDGGWEFNFWTVLGRSEPLIPWEGEDVSPSAVRDSELVCKPSFFRNTPGLHPRYTLSYELNGCGGQVGIPAVQYREWFGPRDVRIYVVSSRKNAAEVNGVPN